MDTFTVHLPEIETLFQTISIEEMDAQYVRGLLAILLYGVDLNLLKPVSDLMLIEANVVRSDEPAYDEKGLREALGKFNPFIIPQLPDDLNIPHSIIEVCLEAEKEWNSKSIKKVSEFSFPKGEKHALSAIQSLLYHSMFGIMDGRYNSVTYILYLMGDRVEVTFRQPGTISRFLNDEVKTTVEERNLFSSPVLNIREDCIGKNIILETVLYEKEDKSLAYRTTLS